MMMMMVTSTMIITRTQINTNKGVNDDDKEDIASLAKKDAQLTGEILDLKKNIKAKDAAARIRKELGQVSPMEELIKARRKIKRLETDRKILLKVNRQSG